MIMLTIVVNNCTKLYPSSVYFTTTLVDKV
jgi:hypothetical protein